MRRSLLPHVKYYVLWENRKKGGTQVASHLGGVIMWPLIALPPAPIDPSDAWQTQLALIDLEGLVFHHAPSVAPAVSATANIPLAPNAPAEKNRNNINDKAGGRSCTTRRLDRNMPVSLMENMSWFEKHQVTATKAGIKLNFRGPVFNVNWECNELPSMCSRTEKRKMEVKRFRGTVYSLETVKRQWMSGPKAAMSAPYIPFISQP